MIVGREKFSRPVCVTGFNKIGYVLFLVLCHPTGYNPYCKEAVIMNLCIAENLKVLRYKSGYTLESLAEIISVSRQTVSKWETGDSVPDIVNCTKLASLYKVSLDELVYRPLKAVVINDFSIEGSCICGVVDLSQEGTIHIPDSVLEMFDIHRGDKILLLADKKQGMALMKCSQF